MENENLLPEEEVSTLTLTDENGVDTTFEYLDCIEYEGVEYLVLMPEDDESGELVILEVEPVDEDMENYLAVEDEAVLNAVFAIFKEKISAKLCLGIALITMSCLLLSFEGVESFSFSAYSAFAFLACIAWGFENNCTRKLSDCDPSKIVMIKGIGSGTGAILVSFALQEEISASFYVLIALVLGFVAYGLSVFLYVSAQRSLGAAKTSSYYAVAPFIGALLSILLLRELPAISFYAAFVIMILGMILVTRDKQSIGLY